MNSIGKLLLGRFLATAMLVSATHSGVAESPKNPPVTADSTPGAIEAARRDFEAVRSLRSLGPESRGAEVPALNLPRLSNDAAPPISAGTTRTNASLRPLTSNWLVEAVEEGRNAPEARFRRRSGDASNGAGGNSGLRSAANVASELGAPDAGPGNVPANPFSRYLGRWMSAQDYALLRTAIEPARSDVLATPNQSQVAAKPPAGAGTTRESVPLSIAAGELLPQRASARTDRTPNPYLETVAPTRFSPSYGSGTPPVITAPSTARGETFRLGNVVSRPSEVSILETKSTQPASRIPEFVRPDNDEKYFKPLKRF